MLGCHSVHHHDGFELLYATLLGLMTLLLAGGEPAQDAAAPVRVMSVEQRLIVRVPVRLRAYGRLRWEEDRNGPKCLPVGALAGASLAGDDGIDFVLRNRQRVRAKLDDDCDGLDFYGSFYVQPEDRRICAGRDTIRSRAGASCEIRRFKMLVPHFVAAE